MVAMSLYRTHSLTPEKLLMLSFNILQQAFFAEVRIEAKHRYQFIESGRTVFLLNVQADDGSELEVKLPMDTSELRGKLNFSSFRRLLSQLLVAQAKQLHEKQPLNVFGDAKQRLVFLIPAAVTIGEQLNMLVLAVELSQPGAIVLELMFIDPNQFQHQPSQSVIAEAGAAETGVA